MGDETREFASLYASAVKELGLLAGEATHQAWERAHRGDVPQAVRRALDAVASVYETGTEGLKDWRARRVQVLARVTALRAALEEGSVDEPFRRRVAELVALLGTRGG